MERQVSTLDLKGFDMSEKRGFLSAVDPTTTFGDSAHPDLKYLEEVGTEIPDLLDNHKLRRTVEKMRPIEPRLLDALGKGEAVMASRIYAFLASAYVHQLEEPKVNKVARGVAVPLNHLSKRLGRKHPILSYDLYALNNWRRLRPDGPVELGNMDTVQKFVNLKDEPWFVLVHVEIESEAGPAIASIGRLQQALLKSDEDSLKFALESISDSLKDTIKTLRRMPEGNDPEQYAFTFRPYIQMFNKIAYEGVDELGPSATFRGETGAQSSIIQSLDSALGIKHAKTGLTDYVADMMNYMPRPHKEFIEAVQANETQRPVREYLTQHGRARTIRAYNQCLERMMEFRQKHVEFAVSYIYTKVKDSSGTGGTPFMQWLGQLRDETGEHIIPI